MGSLIETDKLVATRPDLSPSLKDEPRLLTKKQAKVLTALYSESTKAKIWHVASKALLRATPPTVYPEYTSPGGGTEYVYGELDFWLSGFFPGSLYLLLERQRKYAHLFPVVAAGSNATSPAAATPHDRQLQFACEWWTESLHQNGTFCDNHDLGFMIVPWARPAFQLNGDARAQATLCTAAATLASRYVPSARAIRSWDVATTKTYQFTDPNTDLIVIIDNMMNLDLLFAAAQYTGNTKLRDVAIQHARTTQHTHVRADFSTFHLADLDPATGAIKAQLTNQGYSHGSTWSRGQAWAIAGFAETYHWTEDASFLATARGCADYFIRRLQATATFVPPWDFDAALDVAGNTQKDNDKEPRDTSAAMVAAYGMLLIAQALQARGDMAAATTYIEAALQITEAVVTHHLSPEASFRRTPLKVPQRESQDVPAASDEATLEVDVNGPETILLAATTNNHVHAVRRWADHGLVYADYYFLLVGNKLLEMGLGSLILKHGRE